MTLPAGYVVPAVTLTLWDGNGLAAAVRGSMGALERVRPQCVQLHASPSELQRAAPEAAQRVRTALPGVRLWLGVAGDAGWTQVRDGKLSVATLHARRLAVVDLAQRIGAECVVWDPEQAWKRGNKGFTRADAERLVTEARARQPAVLQGHTSYDCPTLHSDYPWEGWKGCDLFAPQVYWSEGTPAPRGSGARRLAMHRKHWAQAVKAGWLPAGPIAPYLQAHGADTRDLCEVADQYDGVSFWAVPSRCDEQGLRAAQALSKLDALGLRGPGRVRAFQQQAGLVVDGIVGERTCRALGIV